MVTSRSRRILLYLHEAVIGGPDSLREARLFVRGLDRIDCAERLFLESALGSRALLRKFYAAFCPVPPAVADAWRRLLREVSGQAASAG